MDCIVEVDELRQRPLHLDVSNVVLATFHVTPNKPSLVDTEVEQKTVNTVGISVETPSSFKEQINLKAKHLRIDKDNELKILIMNHKQGFSYEHGKADLIKHKITLKADASCKVSLF